MPQKRIAGRSGGAVGASGLVSLAADEQNLATDPQRHQPWAHRNIESNPMVGCTMSAADLSGAAKLIGVIPKNRREQVQIRLREYKGHAFIDIRLHYDDDGAIKSTGKGCTVAPGKLAELIAALQRAEAEAKAAGLL